ERTHQSNGLRNCASRGVQRYHTDGCSAWFCPLFFTGARQGRISGSQIRPVFAGHRAVSNADGKASLPGRQSNLRCTEASAGEGGGAAQGQSANSAERGKHHTQSATQKP